MKKFIYIALWTLAAVSCNYNDTDDYSINDFDYGDTANITISQMKSFYEYGGVTTFTRDYTIEGIVTANDRSGNFYKAFTIEDDTGAVEIKAGLYDLYPMFPEGRKLYVKLKGMTLGAYDGMYQLGLKADKSSGYEVEYLTTFQMLDKYVKRTNTVEEIVPRKMRAESLNDADVGRLVVIKGLSLENGGIQTWAVAKEDSYNGLPGDKDIPATDESESVIHVYTSGYADFALKTIPAGTVSITGIIMKRGSSFRIKMRDINDVAEN